MSGSGSAVNTIQMIQTPRKKETKNTVLFSSSTFFFKLVLLSSSKKRYMPKDESWEKKRGEGGGVD